MLLISHDYFFSHNLTIYEGFSNRLTSTDSQLFSLLLVLYSPNSKQSYNKLIHWIQSPLFCTYEVLTTSLTRSSHSSYVVLLIMLIYNFLALILFGSVDDVVIPSPLGRIAFQYFLEFLRLSLLLNSLRVSDDYHAAIAKMTVRCAL